MSTDAYNKFIEIRKCIINGKMKNAVKCIYSLKYQFVLTHMLGIRWKCQLLRLDIGFILLNNLTIDIPVITRCMQQNVFNYQGT